MKFNKLFKTFNLADDIAALAYVEHDGDASIMHFIVWPDDVGTADLKVKGSAVFVDAFFNAFDFDQAQDLFDKQLKETLSLALDEG